MNIEAIDELRFYSRELIREFGFLNEASKNENLNFAQIHLLLECDRHGAIDQQVLAKNLRINKSYVSRLVKSLTSLGYVDFYEVEHDKRNKPIYLTSLGVEKINEINANARNQVLSAFNYVTPEERMKIIEGIQLYSRALKKSRDLQGISIRLIEPQDNEQLCILIKSVLSEFGANRPGFAYMDEETASMYEFYQEQGKSYFVVQKDNRIIGGIGFAPLSGTNAGICELRKMYLDKEARGRGLGNELLNIAINEAKSTYKTMYLETLSHMTQAISLYCKFGFSYLSAPLGDTGHYSCDTWMMKEIS
ncbi:GNAT family N-acetyltransferase [Legionella lytica]|uniref:GNAT family N-acetyltransferase n=1 Tax=Legionella lytica TaxID=96232 RepID=A0ABW8D8S9_9GAMM